MTQFTVHGQQGNYATDESSEWLEAEGRKWAAVQILLRFGRQNPQHEPVCAARVYALTHWGNRWPLGTGKG